MSGAKTTSQSLAVVATQFPELVRLYVADSAIDGAGLNPLKKLSKLQRLSLAGTAIKDADVATLAELPQLQWLSLDGTTLSDGALAHLETLTQLKVLSLDDESVPTEAAMMEEPLPDSPKRKSLRITDAGLSELKETLKTTKLYHRQLDPQRLAALWVLEQGGSATVSHGEMSGIKVATYDDLPRSACQVNTVSLRDSARFNPAELGQRLRMCKQLTLLDLGGTKVESNHLAGLSALTELTSLNLSNTAVKDDAFAHLGMLPKLRILALQGTFITGKGLAKHSLPTLTHLYVANTDFVDEGLKRLQDSPDLVELDLSYCQAITDRGLAEIAGLTKLQRLELIGTRVTDLAAPTLAKFAALRQLNLYGLPITDNLVSALTKMPDLVEINLTKTKVTDAALSHLASFPKLEIVSVNGTGVTDAGAKTLREMGVNVKKSNDPPQRDQNTSGVPGRF